MIMQIQMVGSTSVKSGGRGIKKTILPSTKCITNGTIKQLDDNSHQKNSNNIKTE